MDYEKIEIIPSKGNSGAVIPIKNNILLPDCVEWPPLELVGKLYRSNHLKHYEKKYHQLLTNELGYYCDLESIKSEDTITWSLFGYISKSEKNIQNNFYNEFLRNIHYGEDTIITIELWKTLPHPGSLTSKGPEIDVFMLGKKYYILIECKWTSGIGEKQGKNKNLNQIQIRNMFKNGIGKRIFLDKECIIVLVANKNIENNLFVSWEKLSQFKSLPHKDMFASYLKWKKRHI